MSSKQFKKWFYGILGLCICLIVCSFYAFDFIEVDLAFDWTMEYFALPIFIIMIPVCYMIYQKFIRQYEKNKNLSGMQMFFKVFILTIGISLILIGTTLSSIILTNGYFGESEPITINTIVIDYRISGEGFRKGVTKHHITFNDPQLGRIVELKVNRAYKVGDPFIKTMMIGKWGLLYSKN